MIPQKGLIMQTIQTQDVKSQLEKILNEVQKDLVPSRIPRLSPPSRHAVYGLCGFAARRVVQKLLAAGFPKEQVGVYTFWYHSLPYHTLAALVPDLETKFSFNETWRVDPIVEEKNTKRLYAPGEPVEERNTKQLYAPGEQYWLDGIPKINADLYFFSENKSFIKLRLTDDKLKFIYDHVKDPPSYLAWQTDVSRTIVVTYRKALVDLKTFLSKGPKSKNEILENFSKYLHSPLKMWLDFLVQEGIYKVEGEEDKIYRKIAEVHNAR